MKAKTIVNTLLVAGLLLAGAVPALAEKRPGYTSFSFGNANAGATGTYSVVAEHYAGVARITASADGSVRFLGRTAKGVGLDVTVDNSNGKRTGRCKLTVLGYTLDSGMKSAGFAFTKTYPVTFITASQQVMVGPVPVVINGSLGGGGSVGYMITLDTKGVGLSGDASAWGTGIASVGPGVKAINVSLKADATVLKAVLKPSLSVTPTSWSGNTRLVSDPLNIDFSIVLQSNIGKKVYEWYKYVFAQYPQPSKSTTLLQL